MASVPARRPVRRALWLSAMLGSLIGALAAYCLVHAYLLQTRLERIQVGAELQAALAPQLGRGDRGRALRPVLDQLLQQAALGLRYLAVRDAEGVLLARHGRYDWLELPLLPYSVSERAQDLLYAVTGSSGARRVFGPDRRLLGSVEYRFEAGEVAAVHDDAVTHLMRAGWVAGLIAIPLLLAAGLLAWRSRAAPPAWAHRADPRAVGAGRPGGPAGPATAVTSLDEFRARAGLVMDALEYGVLTADREGRVTYLNSTAERLTGWNLADARGRMLYSVVHVLDSGDLPTPSAAERALTEGVDVPACSARLRARHGETRPVETMACLIRTREGALFGVTLMFRDNASQARAMDALRREARVSQAVIDHLDEGLLTTDTAGVVRFANARAERMFGYSRDELEGFTITKLMPVPFLNTPDVRITDYIAGRAAGKLPKIVGWRKDATTFPVELWVQPMSLEGDAGLVVILRDISERLRGENLASRLGRLLDNALEEIYIFDAQSLFFLDVNRGARRNLGYRAEQLSRLSPLDISSEIDPETFHNYLARLRGGEQEHLTYRCRLRRHDSTTYPVEVRLSYSREEEPPVFMAVAVDISERLKSEEQLQQLAHYDALTGLPNRVMLYDRLEQARLAAQRGTRMLGVLFLDLDRFKEINDRHGHEVGDLVLKGVAERLQSAVRPTDTVARLAGDEFVILAPGLRSVEDAGFLAQKILERFAHPLDIPGLDIHCRTSIGITLFPLDESDSEGLLRHADAAMYEAKQAGRGTWSLFSTEIDPDKRRRLELEREIHTAVALNQFQVQMTPIMDVERDLSRGALVGLYWQHPRYGRIEQDELLRAAGRAGLLADIELWQACTICEQHFAARQAGLSMVPMVLGISGWQLRDRLFVDHLRDLLSRYQVPADSLILALTPDGFLEAQGMHPDGRQLLKMGLRFGLRDFSRVPDLHPELPLGLMLVGERLLGDEQGMKNALTVSRSRGIPLIAAGVNQSLQRTRWHAAGVRLMAGATLQPAMGGKQLFSWLEGRKVDPL
ncbi:MAG TPA: diguanylate cyclase [Solimonas sp.]|nr:diguanylate cyclase [Solimonas sp.]